VQPGRVRGVLAIRPTGDGGPAGGGLIELKVGSCRPVRFDRIVL
jgi:hypothetical protein